MGHSISGVAMKYRFSRTIISRVYREYRESGRATLPQVVADFNAGPSTSVTVRTIQRNIIDMGFRSRWPSSVPLLTARYKTLRLTWAREHRHWTVDD
ncbi:HTH_Tnp_Tc3_2 domain-containing protein [Trichonephila clavipes]|nr:HTH_Tnp_Tc3_2 domain-containing protein [Trichonephila clavipes]